MMRKGVKNYFKVPVVSISDDANLKKSVAMGRVELIKPLEPLEVRLHQHSANFLSIRATWENNQEKQVTEEQQS